MAIHDKISEEDTQWIIENYPTASWEELTSHLGKSKGAIIAKAAKLGVKRSNVKYSAYSKEEDALLRSVYENSNSTNLRSNLKKLISDGSLNRTNASIRARAYELGLLVRHRWTPEEDAFLIENHLTMTVNELTDHFEKHNRNSVYNRIVKLGLTGGSMFAYTDEEVNYIKQHYEKYSDAELGAILHRSPSSIKEYRRKLGLYHRDLNLPTHYADLLRFVQAHNSQWKKESMAACNYKCVITGGSFDHIHHLYAKNSILNDALRNLGVNRDFDINNCDDETKDAILREFLNEQSKHPLGVCLRGDVHMAYHSKYGRGYNTPDEFKEFVELITQNGLDEICK